MYKIIKPNWTKKDRFDYYEKMRNRHQGRERILSTPHKNPLLGWHCFELAGFFLSMLFGDELLLRSWYWIHWSNYDHFYHPINVGWSRDFECLCNFGQLGYWWWMLSLVYFIHYVIIIHQKKYYFSVHFNLAISSPNLAIFLIISSVYNLKLFLYQHS